MERGINFQAREYALLAPRISCGYFFSRGFLLSHTQLKALINEDTLMQTHCCRHKCFPVCPRAQHLLRTQILCPGHKNVSDFVQKHFVSATNVCQFAQPKKHHEQQCVRNNVSSFAITLNYWVYLHQLWGFCKAWSALYDYVDQ